jgi:hypothetical protein
MTLKRKSSSLKLNIGFRPICPVCNTNERVIGSRRKDGTYNFQSMCRQCKHIHLELKNGRTYHQQIAFNFGFNNIEEYEADKKIRQEIAKAAGFSSIVDYETHCITQEAIAAGFDNVSRYKEQKLAEANGYTTYIDYLNSKHPYRRYRKTYCENIDGRIGGKPCTTTIVLLAQLDVDHIDGNPRNDVEENLQTLCKCCHTLKTIIEKDYATPGRKKLGIKH